MRSLLIFLAVIFISQSTRADNKIKEILRQHAVDWMLALEQKDFAALEKYLASEFTLGGVGDGEKVSRATWLSNARDIGFSNTHYDFLEVHMIDDSAAIVNSKFSFKVSRLPIAVTSNIIDYWVYRDGRWQVTQRLVGGDSLSNLLNTLKGVLIGMTVVILFMWIRKVIKRRQLSGGTTAVML